jgi:cell wall-associated NlpC family hydrolase
VASASGLSFPKRVTARRLAVKAARLGLAHKSALHYTQGARRWDGINHNLKAYRGEYPRYADCSAFVTWCIWNGLSHYGVRDTVNGAQWKAGYTGTMLQHGKRVTGKLAVGDAVIYGRGFPGEHTALYVGSGLVISHGSEAGPFLLPVHYRGDVLQIRRFI